MNNRITLTIGIFAGAAVGILATRSYFKTKYEAKADEEIESMKQYYEKKSKEITIIHDIQPVEKPDDGYISEEPSKTLKEVKPDLPEYGQMFRNQEFVKEPYIIGPDEFFDENDEFEKISLLYYVRDQILADDHDCMLEDVESAVGQEWEDRFGEYVAGIVYVRNEFRHCDYEIMELDASFTDYAE